jgi:prepilin-type N-terminal cleavage/methylation domain-containing protein
MDTHARQRYRLRNTVADRTLHRSSTDAGFTLIELLVVLIIMAILMAVAIPSYLGAKDTARTRQQMRTISTLAQQAKMDTNQPLSALTGTPCSDCACRGAALPLVESPGFLGSACGRAWSNVAEALAPWIGSEDMARKLFTDGWGRPILLDENEGERNYCLDEDQLTSMGSVERMAASGSKVQHARTGKDEVMIIEDIPNVGVGSCQVDGGFAIR